MLSNLLIGRTSYDLNLQNDFKLKNYVKKIVTSLINVDNTENY